MANEFKVKNGLLVTGGNAGFGTVSPQAKIHSYSTTEQLRLGYDGTNYTSFTSSSSGVLTIDPSGGTTYIQGSTSTDAPVLGSELLTGGTWTSTGWTGDNSVGWTHTAGNTNPLSYSATVTAGSLYQITITRSGTQTGTCTYIVGGSDGATVAATNGTYTYCPLAKTTAGIIISPSSDFVGTLVVSLKLFTAGSNPVLSLKSSSGSLSKIEMRTTNNDGDANVYIGQMSGYVNTTGTENTGIGYYALNLNTTGVYNTAIGSKALRYNTSSQNTAIGALSLTTNTTGFCNNALGERALYANTIGYWNTGLGCRSLLANTTGFYNTGVGGQALGSNTTGSNSVAVGLNALYGNTTGYNNVAVGASAGFYIANGSTYNTTPSNSIFIGYGTKALADAQTNQIVIGYNMTGLGSNTTVIGNSSTTITSLKGSVGVGTDAPSAVVHSTGTTEQLRLGYDATKYASFTTDSAGNLTISASGGTTYNSGLLSSNRLEINSSVSGRFGYARFIGTQNSWVRIASFTLNDYTSGFYKIDIADTASDTGNKSHRELYIYPFKTTSNAGATWRYDASDISPSQVGTKIYVSGNVVNVYHYNGSWGSRENEIFLYGIAGINGITTVVNPDNGVSSTPSGTEVLPTVNKAFYGGTVEVHGPLTAIATQDTAALGSELVTNGTFTTDLTGWTAGANWSYSSGTAAHTAGNTATLTQTISGLTVGSYYQLSYTVAVSAGSILSSLGTSTGGTGGHSTAGNKATSFKAATTSEILTFTPSSDFVGSIDNVSLKSISVNSNILLSLNNTLGNPIVSMRSSSGGAYNTFLGNSSGSYCTTGTHNTAVGYNAQAYNPTGYCNTAVGFGSQVALISGEYNTSVGVNSQYYITSGLRNTGIGSGSQFNLTSGNYNNTVGNNSQYSLTTGSYNDAFGINSQYYLTTGNFNSSFGYTSLAGITTGTYNVALGFNAGYYIANGVTANNTGNTSIFIGASTKALADNQANQIVIGYNATGLGANTTIIGNSSTTITSLKGSVGVGSDAPSAKIHSLATTEQLRLGYDATKYTSFTTDSAGNLSVDSSGGTVAIHGSTATDAPTLGAELLTGGTWTAGTGWSGNNTSGWIHTAGNTATLTYSGTVTVGGIYQIQVTSLTGMTAGWAAFTVGDAGTQYYSGNVYAASTVFYNTVRATSTTGLVITPSSDFNGTIIVNSIKQITAGSGSTLSVRSSDGNDRVQIRSNPGGGTSTYVGYDSGGYSGSGSSSNTALGFSTLSSIASGSGNTGVGYRALASTTNGWQNTAVGMVSLENNLNGAYNVALGVATLQNNTSGGANTSIGTYSTLSNTTGSGNTSVGYAALHSNTSGSYNIAIGHGSGRYTGPGANNTTSSNSVYLGYDTRSSASGNTNEIVIGHTAVGNGSNTVTLGNSSITNTYLKGTVNTAAISASGVITSTVAQGTAPFTVTSTTPVANLSIGGSADSIVYQGSVAQPVTRVSNGITFQGVYNNGYPIAYGNVLSIGGSGQGQLLIGWGAPDKAIASNYIRSYRDIGTGDAWSPWSLIITDNNYNSYSPTLTGTGASGTWSINTTGTAGSATVLATARTINGVSFNGSADIMIPSLYDGNYRRITNPGGGEFIDVSGSRTGAIAITMPAAPANMFVKITVKIYEYNANGGYDVVVSGQASGGNSWANYSAYIMGNPSVNRLLSIRFGYAGGKPVVYIGELASTWAYPQVYITEVLCGHSSFSATYTTGWTIGFEASAFSGVIGTVSNCQVGYGTTVGLNLLKIANPSAIRFIQINADNTVSALDAAGFRTAIGAGTSSTSGTVTSVAMTVPTGLTISGSPISTSGTLALSLTSGYSIPTTTSQTNWDTAYTQVSAATSANTVNTIVKRGASGEFSAGAITSTTGTFSGTVSLTKAWDATTGASSLYLNGATGNRIDFSAAGYAAPTTTTRSVGTKIVLYPGISASGVDYGIGIDYSTTGFLWNSVPITSYGFKWYGGTTEQMTLVAGSLGIGTTSPSARVHSISTAEQLRIGYDATHYASFTSASDGNLSINPSGGNTTIYGSVSTAGTTHLGTGAPSSLYVGYNPVNGDLPASALGSRFYMGFVANQSEFASNYGHLFGTWDANGSSGTTPGYAYQLFKPYTNGTYLQYRHGLGSPYRWSAWETILTSGQFVSSASGSPIAGPDTSTVNGVGYVTTISLFGQTDGALYTQAHSSPWVHQIYGDYRTGQIAIRGKNNNSWQAWRTVLDSSNYNTVIGAAGGFTGTVTITKAWDATTGASSLYLNGATGNRIDFAGTGLGAPTTTTRSTGTKIILYPGISGTDVDNAIGMDNATLWSSVGNSTCKFKWYGATTSWMELNNNGLGIGAGPLAKLHSVSTAEQLRLGYDATKYASFTVDAVGNLTTTSTIGVSTSSATVTTTSTTQTALASFAVASYISGEYLVQAVQGTIRQITKLLVVHDGTTAYATEYGTVLTGARLFNIDTDISGGNARVLVTTMSATSTTYKTSFTLIGV